MSSCLSGGSPSSSDYLHNIITPKSSEQDKEKLIMSLTTKEMNQICKVLSISENKVQEMKNIRRTLKNRIYAHGSRKRKLEAIDRLKDDVQHLENQFNELKIKLHKLMTEYDKEVRNVLFYCEMTSPDTVQRIFEEFPEQYLLIYQHSQQKSKNQFKLQNS